MTTEALELRTLTIPEAAKVLGIGRTSAYRAARAGELPILKIRNRVLVSRDGLDEMLRGARATSRAE